MYYSQIPSNYSNLAPSPNAIKTGQVLVSNRGLEHINCIIPAQNNRGGLFLGDVICTLKTQLLQKHQIKTVLSCMIQPISKIHQSIQNHKILPIRDTLQFSIFPYFKQAKQFIDEARIKGHNVLVHCHAGVSRSATIVCAYLMLENKWNTQKAIQFIRQKRYRAKPNANFFNQLKMFEEQQLKNLINKEQNKGSFFEQKSDQKVFYCPPLVSNNFHSPRVNSSLPYGYLQRQTNQKQQVNLFQVFSPNQSKVHQKNPSKNNSVLIKPFSQISQPENYRAPLNPFNQITQKTKYPIIIKLQQQIETHDELLMLQKRRFSIPVQKNMITRNQQSKENHRRFDLSKNHFNNSINEKGNIKNTKSLHQQNISHSQRQNQTIMSKNVNEIKFTKAYDPQLMMKSNVQINNKSNFNPSQDNQLNENSLDQEIMTKSMVNPNLAKSSFIPKNIYQTPVKEKNIIQNESYGLTSQYQKPQLSKVINYGDRRSKDFNRLSLTGQSSSYKQYY